MEPFWNDKTTIFEAGRMKVIDSFRSDGSQRSVLTTNDNLHLYCIGQQVQLAGNEEPQSQPLAAVELPCLNP